MDQSSGFTEAGSINPVPLGDEKSREGQYNEGYKNSGPTQAQSDQAETNGNIRETRNPLKNSSFYKKTPETGSFRSSREYQDGGPPRSRTEHQRIMLTTSVFTARFRFVVWTVSCLYDLPVQSLHLRQPTGQRLARDHHALRRGFPEFE